MTARRGSDYRKVSAVKLRLGRIRFFYEFSHFNSDCLGAFLEQFSQEYSDEIHIIQLDNAPCHTTHKLIVPENVILLFQTLYLS